MRNVSNTAGDDPTTALATAAGRGDRVALAAWVRATQADVWRLLAHLADPDRADDLTQETYLRAITSLPRFARRSSSRTWLLSIARRVLVDHIRAAGARPRQAAYADREPAEGPSGAGFEDLVELKLLLADLTPERREILVLTQVIGLSYQEAAEVCGCPLGTVRSRVARAREDLLAAMRTRDEDAR